MKKHISTITLLLTIFTFSACAEATTVADTGCNTELISDKSLEMLLDGPFNKVTLEGLPQGTQGCKYVSTKKGAAPENNEPGTEANMNYIMGQTETAEQAKAAYDRAVATWQTEAMQNRKNQTVPEVGAEAFWSYGESLSQFIVYQNTTFVIVTIAHFDVDEETALFKARRMARILLEDPTLPTNW